jgi:hypothetical protein
LFCRAAGDRRDERDVISAGKIDDAPVRCDPEPIDDEFHDASVLVGTSRCKNAALDVSAG